MDFYLADRRADRLIPRVIDATAAVERTYPYPSERLWFVAYGNRVMAVMAVSSDDAWMSVDDAIPSLKEINRLSSRAGYYQIHEPVDRIGQIPQRRGPQ